MRALSEGSAVRELIGAEVLVIDQDPMVRKGVVQLLSAAMLHVTAVQDAEAGLAALDKRFFSVVLVDLDTPSPGAGLTTMRGIRERSPTSMIVALTPRKSYADVVSAIRSGAIDVILKSPESVAYLKERILEAAGRSVDKREVNSILSEVKQAHSEFLERFMEAERRALDLSDRVAGRDASQLEMVAIQTLIVDESEGLARSLTAGNADQYQFEHALSGAQALDLVGSGQYHIALVSEALQDLPSSMVVRSIKTQNPEIIVLSFSGPNPPGKVELAETRRRVSIIEDFRSPSQLLDRMGELTEAFRAKTRERRYTQAFRERHYDFLRRYVELKNKIERSLVE